MALTATRFDGVSPVLARLVLGAYAVIALIVLSFSFPVGPAAGVGPAEEGDIATYQKVIDALQAGVPYYEALHTELIEGGYGTRSVFNWRSPFFLSALALSPSPLFSQGLLIAIAAAAMVAALGLVKERRWMFAALGGLLVMSLLSVLVENAQIMCEIFAGVLILLSVAAYGHKLPWLGFAAAVLALFCRELVAPYILICVWFAYRDWRWTELGAWAVALLAYGIYFAWHSQMAMSMIGPADRAYPDGWLQFGGIGFDLATANFNGVFLLLPLWVTGLILPLSVLGLLAWPTKAGERVLITVLAYLVLFAFVGKAMNMYWGAVYAPLLALGVVWSIPALRDLVRAAMPERRLAA